MKFGPRIEDREWDDLEHVKIGARAPPEQWEEFKRFSEQKHGRKRCASRELSRAMDRHMAAERVDDEGELSTPARAREGPSPALDELIRQVAHLESRVADLERKHRPQPTDPELYPR